MKRFVFEMGLLLCFVLENGPTWKTARLRGSEAVRFRNRSLFRVGKMADRFQKRSAKQRAIFKTGPLLVGLADRFQKWSAFCFKRKLVSLRYLWRHHHLVLFFLVPLL